MAAKYLKKHPRQCGKPSTSTNALSFPVIRQRKTNALRVAVDSEVLGLSNTDQRLVHPMNYRRTVWPRRHHVLRTALRYL